MAGTIKFFFDFMSPPSRALYMLFKLDKIPFEPHLIALRKGEHLTDDYKKNVNKFRKVPVIHDNGFVLTESVAILRYLSAKGLVSNKWYPAEIKERARVDEYLEWHHNNIVLGSGLYFQAKWLMPLLSGGDADPKQVREAQKILEAALDSLEKIWLTDSKFVGGNQITVADLFATSFIEHAKTAGFDSNEGKPKIKAWMELVRNSTNPIYDEAHKFSYKNRAFAKL